MIKAPPERCFDLSLSVDLHLASTAHTDERVVAGPAGGLLGPGDTITWEARHFGKRRRLTVRISGYERPRWFRDEMVAGPLRQLRHDHHFEPVDDSTIMRDEFEFASAIPLFDRLVLQRHFRQLLVIRNETIRRTAEGAARNPPARPRDPSPTPPFGGSDDLHRPPIQRESHLPPP